MVAKRNQCMFFQYAIYVWKQKWKSFSLNFNKKKKESLFPQMDQIIVLSNEVFPTFVWINMLKIDQIS